MAYRDNIHTSVHIVSCNNTVNTHNIKTGLILTICIYFNTSISRFSLELDIFIFPYHDHFCVHKDVYLSSLTFSSNRRITVFYLKWSFYLIFITSLVEVKNQSLVFKSCFLCWWMVRKWSKTSKKLSGRLQMYNFSNALCEFKKNNIF